MNKLNKDKIVSFAVWKIIYPFFRLLPIQNKIYFDSFLGKEYSDNPKAIYEYLLNNNYNYKYVWVLKNPKIKIKGAKVVKRISFKYLYEVATAKYIITNSRMPLDWSKKKKQVYVQTWHGTPLKRLVYDMENVTLPDISKEKYLNDFTKDVNKWDFLLSPNPYSTKIFKRAFKYDGTIIENKYPRNEKLYSYTKEEVDKIKRKLNIPKENKVILYAPTFRDNMYSQKGKYIQKINFDINKINEIYNNKVNFLLRTHYLVNEIDYKYKNQKIIDVSNYNDINDLYIISDLLITDYSSVFFDYMILQKPILFYQYDQKEYKDDIRGFYIPLEDLPGKVIQKENELYESITNYSDKVDETKKKYDFFLYKYNVIIYSGHVKDIVQRIFN